MIHKKQQQTERRRSRNVSNKENVTISLVMILAIFLSTPVSIAAQTYPGENTGQTTSSTATNPIIYGAKVYSLSYGQINTATWSSVEKELISLKQIGVSYYSIHLNFDPWIKNQTSKIAIIDQAVSWIKANNGSLHLVDAGAESLRKNPILWEDFKVLFGHRVTMWTVRYHPDVFTTIKEPGYYLPMIKDANKLSINEFASLSFELNALTKSISPETSTAFADNANGFGKSNFTIDMWQLVADDPNLDIMGLDIYGKCGVDDSTQFLDLAVQSAKEKGKSVWITETWGSTEPKKAGCTNQSSIEVNWASYISGYASSKGIPVVEWFFTQRFSDTSGQLTPTYWGILDVMKDYIGN